MPKIVLTSELAAPPDLVWRAIEGVTRQVELQGAGRFVNRTERNEEGARVTRFAIVDSPLPDTNCTVEVRVPEPTLKISPR